LSHQGLASRCHVVPRFHLPVSRSPNLARLSGHA
jgi:hypothetical protein